MGEKRKKMINENELRNRGKLNFFLEQKIDVHIKRNDKKFWNGILIEKKSDDVFVMKEKELGIVHLFVSDVYDVTEFRKVEE